MSKSGHPDSEVSVSVGWPFIGLAIALVFGVCALTWRSTGALMGLLFVPEPPMPPAILQRTHTSEGYGTDTWRVDSQATSCELVVFYQQHGTCEVYAGYCGESGQPRDALAAQCRGDIPFAEFVVRWQADIYDYPRATTVELARDTAWTRGSH